MIWFFKRGHEDCTIETSFDEAAQEFVLRTFKGVTKQHEERFRDAKAFASRLERLEAELTAEHWQAIGSPMFLRDGWKI